MRPVNCACHLCVLMVICPFAEFHPCKVHTQQVLCGEPVPVLFSCSQMSFERLNLKRQFFKIFLSLQKKNGLINVTSVFNYVESQYSCLPSQLLSPLPDHQLLRGRDHGFCLWFILLNVFKAG